jgi:D-xylose transport system substrate-binding protein
MKQARILLVLGSFVLSVTIGLLLNRTPNAPPPSAQELLVGLSLDTLKEARWQVDKRLFEEQVTKLGGKTITLSANSDDTTQIGDVEKLITQGVKVLVIVPHDGKAMRKAVELAHQAKIPVIAYDRIIPDSDLDLYVSFDNVKVGELQADYLVKHLKTPGKGKLVRISGSKTDNNALLFKQGQDNVLGPYIARGDITIVHEDWADDWKPEVAKRIMNAAISSHGTDFDGVLAANDGTAGGAVQALTEENLTGQKLVTGQDAELVACQRIMGGSQTMTIYKPIKILATSAATLAVKLAQGKPVIAQSSVDNGKLLVPSVLNDVVVVTRENMMDTVVKDGFHTEAELQGKTGTSP